MMTSPPSAFDNPDDALPRPDSPQGNQAAEFDGSQTDSTGTVPTIRLGCVHCDRSDYDGVDVLPHDWQNVTEVQSWEDAVKPVETGSASQSVHNWQTHLGICPECVAMQERTSEATAADSSIIDIVESRTDEDDTHAVHPIIRQIIDRDCHVGTSSRDVVRHVISKLKNGYQTFRNMPPEDRQQLIDQCIQHHASNIRMYVDVMTGFSSPRTKKAAVSLPPSTLSGPQLVSLMRKHKVSIASLAIRLGSTQKRVRQLRETGLQDPHVVRDWMEAITGQDPGPLPERYRVNDIREETECCFCGYPLFNGDEAWEYVSEVFCSISCCRKSKGW